MNLSLRNNHNNKTYLFITVQSVFFPKYKTGAPFSSHYTRSKLRNAANSLLSYLISFMSLTDLRWKAPFSLLLSDRAPPPCSWRKNKDFVAVVYEACTRARAFYDMFTHSRGSREVRANPCNVGRACISYRPARRMQINSRCICCPESDG